MKPTLIYIHGLGSDRNSRKFKNLKDYFKDQFEYDFLEWKNDSDVKKIIEEKLQNYQNINQLIIVGDSTGANFAYQLREMRNKKEDKLILTSPLLNIEMRIANFDFPKSLLPYLIKIAEPKNALIIGTKKDEILNQTWLFKKDFENISLKEVDDNHRLEKFHEFLPKIELYLKYP